jgi:hypothetical protein
MSSPFEHCSNISSGNFALSDENEGYFSATMLSCVSHGMSNGKMYSILGALSTNRSKTGPSPSFLTSSASTGPIFYYDEEALYQGLPQTPLSSNVQIFREADNTPLSVEDSHVWAMYMASQSSRRASQATSSTSRSLASPFFSPRASVSSNGTSNLSINQGDHQNEPLHVSNGLHIVPESTVHPPYGPTPYQEDTSRWKYQASPEAHPSLSSHNWCDLCQKSFGSKSDFLKHNQRHDPQSLHICPLPRAERHRAPRDNKLTNSKFPTELNLDDDLRLCCKVFVTPDDARQHHKKGHRRQDDWLEKTSLNTKGLVNTWLKLAWSCGHCGTSLDSFDAEQDHFYLCVSACKPVSTTNTILGLLAQPALKQDWNVNAHPDLFWEEDKDERRGKRLLKLKTMLEFGMRPPEELHALAIGLARTRDGQDYQLEVVG